MAVNITKGQIWSGTISKIKSHQEYHFCVENVMLVSKPAQDPYYAALLI